MMKQTTCYGCDKREARTVTMPMEEFDKLEKLALSAHTDELSVEKLQEQNKTMKLALVELSDENIYDNTGFFANEYAKNLVEQIDAGEIETIVERCIRNHQEQLNTAKKYIEHVIGTIKHDGHLGTIQTDWILAYLEKVLEEIGGDDD